MKPITKILTSVAVVFALLCTFSTVSKAEDASVKLSYKNLQESSIRDGGFYFHFGVFLPSKKYFVPVALDVLEYWEDSDFEKFGAGLDFEIGNMFQLVDNDPIAIGLRTTWLTANYSVNRFDDTTAARALTGSMFRLGPYFTFAFHEKMAIDVFYQLGATYGIVLADDWDNEGSSGALGVTHELGAAYRFDRLSVGLGYKFGKIRDLDRPTGYTSEFKDTFRSRVNGLRLFIGVKI